MDADAVDAAAARLARALDYPYTIATRSFVLAGGQEQPFSAAATAGRVPVLAYGSNQSPEQLRRKFAAADAPVAVQRAVLGDHDVVYSAHLASYGAVPAALRHVPGTRVGIAVTWLARDQVAHMHATELPHGNYAFARLDGIDVTLAEGGRLTTAYAYVNTRGHLDWHGAAVGAGRRQRHRPCARDGAPARGAGLGARPPGAGGAARGVRRRLRRRRGAQARPHRRPGAAGPAAGPLAGNDAELDGVGGGQVRFREFSPMEKAYAHTRMSAQRLGPSHWPTFFPWRGSTVSSGHACCQPSRGRPTAAGAPGWAARPWRTHRRKPNGA